MHKENSKIVCDFESIAYHTLSNNKRNKIISCFLNALLDHINKNRTNTNNVLSLFLKETEVTMIKPKQTL